MVEVRASNRSWDILKGAVLALALMTIAGSSGLGALSSSVMISSPQSAPTPIGTGSQTSSELASSLRRPGAVQGAQYSTKSSGLGTGGDDADAILVQIGMGSSTDPSSPLSVLGATIAAPTASTTYKATTDLLINSSGGTGMSITIYDQLGNVILSGLTTLSAFNLKLGMQINFGAFSVAPTVAVFQVGE